jgi:hypothetical protein
MRNAKRLAVRGPIEAIEKRRKESISHSQLLNRQRNY